MNLLTFILSTHIIVAVFLTFMMTAVMAAALTKRESKSYLAMLSSFGFVVLSGFALIVVSPGSLGKFCAMMSVFTLMALGVRWFYRRQLRTNTTI